MTIQELQDILYKLSITFVKDNNTMIGSYTYQDLEQELYMASRRRNIVDDLQIFEAYEVMIENIEYTEAVFQFSPNYLNRADGLVYTNVGELEWALLMPKAIDRIGNDKLENDTEGIQAELIEKLACSKIVLKEYVRILEISKEEFLESLADEF